MKLIRYCGLMVLAAFAVGCGGGGSGDGPALANETTLQVRVVHASPNAGVVDVYLRGAAEAVIEDFAYGDTTPFLSVPTGTYGVDVRPPRARPSSRSTA